MQKQEFKVKIPSEAGEVRQGEEEFIIEYKGESICIKAHDYDAIYKIPGLYEHLFYKNYKCVSPRVVCEQLTREVETGDQSVGDLKVLDVGAGNGMMGEELMAKGADMVIGVDIIEEAAEAAERDRPGVYSDYIVADLTRPPVELKDKIKECSPNCMTVVAALGFDDIPPRAFAGAYNMISDQGWVAFNIKDEFYDKNDRTGFSRLFDDMTDSGVFEMKSKKRYRHRLCQDGTPLQYYAVVGRKEKDIPDVLLNR